MNFEFSKYVLTLHPPAPKVPLKQNVLFLINIFSFLVHPHSKSWSGPCIGYHRHTSTVCLYSSFVFLAASHQCMKTQHDHFLRSPYTHLTHEPFYDVNKVPAQIFITTQPNNYQLTPGHIYQPRSPPGVSWGGDFPKLTGCVRKEDMRAHTAAFSRDCLSAVVLVGIPNTVFDQHQPK